MKHYTVLFILTVTVWTCNVHAAHAQNPSHAQMNIRKIAVDEVLQTTNYTYLHGDVDGMPTWVALPKIEAETGKTYYYKQGIEMRNFKSTELKRTFDVVWFIQGVESADLVKGKKGEALSESQIPKKNANPHNQEAMKKKIFLNSNPGEGFITIAELFKNKEKYKNKTVKIKGEVVKYNSNIMGKNWIHLQDGTNYSGKFDLTIITDMEAKTGEILAVEGKIALDKDFGFGYYYEIIMVEARILDN